MATKWEYYVDSYEPSAGSYNTADLKGELNKLGEQGWELASMIEHVSGESIADFTFVLKRPKP